MAADERGPATAPATRDEGKDAVTDGMLREIAYLCVHDRVCDKLDLLPLCDKAGLGYGEYVDLCCLYSPEQFGWTKNSSEMKAKEKEHVLAIYRYLKTRFSKVAIPDWVEQGEGAVINQARAAVYLVRRNPWVVLDTDCTVKALSPRSKRETRAPVPVYGPRLRSWLRRK
jgi:hypothetical protein